MKSFFVALLCGVFMAHASTADAHLVMKKAFQTKYEFKSVTCFACHAKGKDKDGKRLGKEALNDLGKAMKQNMGNGEVSRRMEEAKTLDRATQKEIHDQVAAEFLEAMKKVEEMKSPTDDVTWGTLIEEAKIDGVKKKSK